MGFGRRRGFPLGVEGETWIEPSGEDSGYCLYNCIDDVGYPITCYHPYATMGVGQRTPLGYPMYHIHWYRALIRFALASLPVGAVIKQAILYLYLYGNWGAGTRPQVCQMKRLTERDAADFPTVDIDLDDWDTDEEAINDAWLDSASAVGWQSQEVGSFVQADYDLGRSYFATRLRGSIENCDPDNHNRYFFYGANTTTSGSRPDGTTGYLRPLLYVSWWAPSL